MKHDGRNSLARRLGEEARSKSLLDTSMEAAHFLERMSTDWQDKGNCEAIFYCVSVGVKALEKGTGIRLTPEERNDYVMLQIRNFLVKFGADRVD